MLIALKVYNRIAERLDENSDYDGKWPSTILLLRSTRYLTMSQMAPMAPSFSDWHGMLRARTTEKPTPVEGG
jgi:hypothetical protein